MTDANPRTQIVQHELPIIEGDYEIQATQTLGGIAETPVTLKSTQTFRVARDPQLLSTNDVKRVYPPAYSEGNFRHVIPSISLSRSTLPWERIGCASDPTLPGLALLVFHEEEAVAETRVPLADLPTDLRPTGDAPAGGSVTVLEVPHDLFATLLPSAEQVRWLCHVQHGMDAQGQTQWKEANVLAGRFAKQGKNTAHLVFLENRWDEAGQFQRLPSETDTVRLISLYSWQFSHSEATSDLDFLEHVRLLAQQAKPLTLNPYGKSDRLKAKVGQGFTALPYQVQDGSQSAAWYHGPLAPGATQRTLVYAAQSEAYSGSDRWLRLDTEEGMFDTSYALAWELGRLLALQNTRFATGLSRWKRQHRMHGHQHRQHTAMGHGLPFAAQEPSQEIPDYVRQWLIQLTQLEGVPFSYLVPDKHMLPVDSLRLFRLNVPWVQALVYGTLSLGGETGATEMMEELFPDAYWEGLEPYSGLIIRSQVVKDYPDFYVSGEGVNPVRQVRLSPDTLLCLFDGNPSAINLDSQHSLRHFAWPYGHDSAPDRDPLDYQAMKSNSKTDDIPSLVNFLSKDRFRVVLNV